MSFQSEKAIARSKPKNLASNLPISNPEQVMSEEILEEQVETVLVGQVGPARGLKGEVLVRPYTDQPDFRFAVGETLYDADGHPYPIINYRIVKNRYCLTFANVTNRNQAEDIRGRKLYADIVPEWEAEDDAFRKEELVGLKVISQPQLLKHGLTIEQTIDLSKIPANLILGQVSDLIYGAVQDLLEVDAGGEEPVLLPFVQDLVPQVNPSAGYLLTDPPAGLFPEVGKENHAL